MAERRSSKLRRVVSDELWALVEPLIRRVRRRSTAGPVGRGSTIARPWEGILFVLETGVPWKKLPSEHGFGSGITYWRRLRAWQDAGVWDQLHQAVLDRLGQQGLLDWSRACLDSVSVRAKSG